MSLSFQDLQEALTLDDRDEFVIWQNSSKRNKRVKRGNLFASKGVTVRGKFIDAESGDDVGLAAAQAEINAGLAQSTANGAVASANGRNRIFYQNTAPTSPVNGYELINGDMWFNTSSIENYAMYTWNTSLGGANKWELREVGDLSIARINAGKIVAGFIGSQVIAINGTDVYNNPVGAGGYIESTSFVLTWPGANLVEVKAYNASETNLGKDIASDIVQAKKLTSDGSYRLFRSKANQPKSPSQIGPLDSGWETYWDEITGASIPTTSIPITTTESKSVQNFGFRIASNGYAEFTGAIFRGAIVSNEGFFGTTANAVRLDDKGLTVGNNGYLKSRGVGYNGTSFFATSGTSGGFFLGNTLAEGDPDDLYQLFVGKPTGNNLWWNGNNLLINGSLAAFATGTAGTSGFGLTIASGFGIRYIDNNSVLTITGGRENGVPSGAQIDLVGSNYLNGTGGEAGLLILQAGSGDGSEIRFHTNVSNENAIIGAIRMTIANTGLVSILKTQTAGASYTTGAGNLYVQSNVGVGIDPENSHTGSAGKIWANEEVAVYNGAIRSVILKKTDGAGTVFLKDSGDSITITLNGGSGEVSASSYNSTSSKKFKKKIKNLKAGLDTVNSLRPVTFNWKNKNKQNDIGLIAEEVNQILPMVVAKDEKGEASGLDYGRLTTVLIQAVKELSVEVDRLKNKIK